MVRDFIHELDLSFEDLKAIPWTTVRIMKPFTGRDEVRDGKRKYSPNYIRPILKRFFEILFRVFLNYLWIIKLWMTKRHRELEIFVRPALVF